MPQSKGDTNGNGVASRKLLNKPLIALIALALAVVSPALIMAYGYGQVTRDVEAGAIRDTEITERIDRVEQRVVKELDKINGRLDELIRFLLPTRVGR